MLLERADELAALERHASRARTSRGGLVMVCGEAGSGKTSLIQAFIDSGTVDVPVLFAACDPLPTPRPLGPLQDLAAQLDQAARDTLRSAPAAHDIYLAVHEFLCARPCVLVIDDLHWSDQGTVDLLRFLLRRIGSTSTLVVGSVRDEELDVSHPMRMLLGDVARSADAISLALRPLSHDAIRTLFGGRPVDVARIEHLTGGNPFFLGEMVDQQPGELPTSVRDAILSRAAALDEAGWDLMHVLACCPEAIGDHMLADLGLGLPALRSAERAGLIRRHEKGVSFRHELCRLAIASTLPPGAEVLLHRRIIAALENGNDRDDAILVHHALAAGDRDRVARHGPAAGRAAARAGAHTQAAAFYRSAILHGTDMAPEDEAALLEAMAFECYLIDELERAIAASRRALELRAKANDASGVSHNHHCLALFNWYDANRPDALRHADHAVAVAEGPGDTTQLTHLGHAHATTAFLALQASNLDDARSATRTAADLAGATGDFALAVRSAVSDALVDLIRGDADARQRLVSILGTPEDVSDEIYSSGYSNLGYLDVEQRRLTQAEDLFSRSIPITIERDLPICRVWQLGSRSRMHLLLGDWDAALLDANAVLSAPSAPLVRTWPHLVRGLIELRRDGGGQDDLAHAWALAARFDEPLRLLPTLAALAERAWLTGVPDPRLDLALDQLADGRAGLEWARGDLAVWLRRIGVAVTDSVPADTVAEPYRHHLSGDPRQAADRWATLAAPYDQALALLDSGDAGDALTALELLELVHADAVASKARQDLANRGIASRQPNRRPTATRNPGGLSSRELDVLRLLGAGHTNAEVATQLHLSPKTVDHHVSAILAKLHVPNRREAARTGRQLGLID